jgi:2'-5' RNA ligase
VTSYAVVAYPRFGEADAAWVESVRAAHDPQFTLIRAHFTLVFPLATAADTLAAHVASCLAGQGAFEVMLGSAAAHRDEPSAGSYVFLLPSAGTRELVELHEALYAGEFRRHRRDDMPYAPHITVGHKPDHAECVALANDLNRRGLALRGDIDCVDTIALDAGRITAVATAPLGTRRRRPESAGGGT